MKIIIFFLIIICTIVPLSLVSQGSNCDPKTIRTDPNNAINSEREQKTNTDGIILNWLIDLPDEFNVYSQFYTPQITTIASPFDQLNNIATDHFRTNKDRAPVDGWELIYRQFGYEDDGDLGSNEDNPFFVLYNRYTGIMRVFVAIAAAREGYSYARIKMYNIVDGDNIATSMLDLGLSDTTKPLRALDDFAPNTVLDNICYFVNNPKKWFYADFPMLYDPCTCFYTSKLNIRVFLVEQADIQLKGDLTGVLAAITDKASTDPNSEVDQKKSSLSMALEAGEKAIKTYKERW